MILDCRTSSRVDVADYRADPFSNNIEACSIALRLLLLRSALELYSGCPSEVQSTIISQR